MNRNFKLQFFNKYETIFEFGDIGNTYYIVLKGQVICLIPNAEKINVEESEMG
jgi:hypothetical protein